MRTRPLSWFSVSVVVVLALQFAGPAGAHAATGVDQSNYGTPQMGQKVSVSGNSGPNIAICKGCNVTQILINNQSINAPDLLPAVLQSLGISTSGSSTKSVRISRGFISFCIGCNVMQEQTNNQSITSSDSSNTGGNQSNHAASQMGAIVSATGSGSANIALCIGCNVLEVNVNVQDVNTDTSAGASSTGGTQDNVAAVQTGAMVVASGSPLKNLSLCRGCMVTQENVNVQVVAAAGGLNATISAIGGNQSNTGAGQYGSSLSASGGSTNVALCFNCDVVQGNSNSQPVSASAGP